MKSSTRKKNATSRLLPLANKSSGVGLLVAAIVMLFSTTVTQAVHASEPPAIVQTPAEKIQPTLSVTLLNGKHFDLADQRGKWVIVNFWATWCPPCVASMPAISQFVAERADVSAVGVAVMQKKRQAAEKFAAKHALNFPLAWSASQKPPKSFAPLEGIPTTYLIAPDGTLAKSLTGQLDVKQLGQAMQSAGYSGKP